MKTIKIEKVFFEEKDKEKFEYWLVVNNMTKTQFAKKAGLTRQSLYNILDGITPVNEEFLKEYYL